LTWNRVEHRSDKIMVPVVENTEHHRDDVRAKRGLKQRMIVSAPTQMTGSDSI
jgi:hypothetical protein